MYAQKVLALEDTVTALKAEVSELKTALEQLLPLSSLKEDYESLALMIKKTCDSKQENEKGREWVEVVRSGSNRKPVPKHESIKTSTNPRVTLSVSPAEGKEGGLGRGRESSCPWQQEGEG